MVPDAGPGSGWLLGGLGTSGPRRGWKCHHVWQNLSNATSLIMQSRGLTWSEAKVSMVSLPGKGGIFLVQYTP